MLAATTCHQIRRWATGSSRLALEEPTGSLLQEISGKLHQDQTTGRRRQVAPMDPHHQDKVVIQEGLPHPVNPQHTPRCLKRTP